MGIEQRVQGTHWRRVLLRILWHHVCLPVRSAHELPAVRLGRYVRENTVVLQTTADSMRRHYLGLG